MQGEVPLKEEMLTEEFLHKIKDVIGNYVSSLGYEVVGLNLYKSSGIMTLKILADKPLGGISIDECGYLNRELGEFLDREGIFQASYILEVSSPGADRQLLSEKDFLRVSGYRVRVFLSQPLEGKMEIEGKVASVKDNCLFLDLNGKITQIVLNQVKRGKQVIE